MGRLLSNIILLCVISFGVYKLIDYQYGRSYYKQVYSQLSVEAQYAELDCLAENIYYEASGESLAGKIAVGQITINRVNSATRSTRFKNTICKSVHQASQFSWVKDKPRALVNINKRVYNDSREVAKKLLFENERISTLDKPNILYYHADYVTPTWAKHFKFVTRIGHHLYYERYENGKW